EPGRDFRLHPPEQWQAVRSGLRQRAAARTQPCGGALRASRAHAVEPGVDSARGRDGAVNGRLATFLSQRLSNRPDSEHGQAIVRLAILLIVLVYMLARKALQQPDPAVDTGAGPVMVMVMIGFALGSLIVGWILARPKVSHPRRVLGMLSDYGLMAAAMLVMGEPLAWVYVILWLVTIGNGLRFGTR